MRYSSEHVLSSIPANQGSCIIAGSIKPGRLRHLGQAVVDYCDSLNGMSKYDDSSYLVPAASA